MLYIGVSELESLVWALPPSSYALTAGKVTSGRLRVSGKFAGSLIVVATSAPLHKRPLLTDMTKESSGASQIIDPLLEESLHEMYLGGDDTLG